MRISAFRSQQVGLASAFAQSDERQQAPQTIRIREVKLSGRTAPEETPKRRLGDILGIDLGAKTGSPVESEPSQSRGKRIERTTRKLHLARLQVIPLAVLRRNFARWRPILANPRYRLPSHPRADSSTGLIIGKYRSLHLRISATSPNAPLARHQAIVSLSRAEKRKFPEREPAFIPRKTKDFKRSVSPRGPRFAFARCRDEDECRRVSPFTFRTGE